MLPWGHAALGYILYSLYTRWRRGHPPIGLTVIALGIGTQFPDLIDKPLTWTLPLLPYGRSLAHSLFALVLICTVVWVRFQYPDQRALTGAFTVGYGTHLLGDAIGPILYGDYLSLGYLLWPLTAVPVNSGPQSFLAFALELSVTPLVIFGLILTIGAAGLWLVDGCPGICDLQEESTRISETDAQPRRDG